MKPGKRRDRLGGNERARERETAEQQDRRGKYKGGENRGAAAPCKSEGR